MRIKLNLKILLIFLLSIFLSAIVFVSSVLVGYYSKILENYDSETKNYVVDESKEKMFVAIKSHNAIQLYKKGMFGGSDFPDYALKDLPGHGLGIENDEVVVKNNLLFLQKVFKMDVTKDDLVDYTIYPYINFDDDLEFVVTIYNQEFEFNAIKENLENSIDSELFPLPFILDFVLRENHDLFDLMVHYNKEFIVKDDSKENIVMTNISKDYLRNNYSFNSVENTSLRYIKKDVIETALRRKPKFDVVDYPISFSDGQTFYISYCFKGDYQILYLVSLFLSLMTFLLTFILMTKPIINYIKDIENGIVKVSQGNTETKIKIKGNDELTSLACNVNMLTKTLREGFNKEKELETSRRSLITHISHDLLTPVTTIMGYLTLISENKWNNIDEMKSYVNGAIKKSEDLKTMIENVLSYSLVLKNEPKAILTAEPLNKLLRQYLDECMVIACNAGFKIKTLRTNNYLGDVLCSETYLNRVVGNIILNATRHGCSNEPILLNYLETDTHIELIIENGTKKPDCNLHSNKDCLKSKKNNGLGLKICKQLMKMQEGYIETKYLNEDEVSNKCRFVAVIGIKKNQ